MSLFRILFALCAASSFAATNAAVLSFTPGSGVDSSESLIISERFQTELLATGEYTVLDRQQMAAILQEQGFQQSGACNGRIALYKSASCSASKKSSQALCQKLATSLL